MTLRTLICDDERLAIARMRQLLVDMPEVEVVGEARTAAEALVQVETLQPDMVLLDIEMPVTDGLALARQLIAASSDAAPSPQIIFVTAYANFALDAFDHGVVDFLTKPVRKDRLRLALKRARETIDGIRSRQKVAELESMPPAPPAASAAPADIWVRTRGQMVRVPQGDLERVSSEREYVRLYAGETNYLHRASLSAMLELLAPGDFLRIHRSHAVRREAIASVRRLPSGDHQVRLRSGEWLPVGRDYWRKIRDEVQPG